MIKRISRNIERGKILSSRLYLKQQCKLSLNSAKSPKQLLIDISIISRNDAGTGIQRAVRGILKELIENPPSEYVIGTIGGTRTKLYKYIDGREITVNPGDVFFGLDLSASAVSFNYRQLAEWKKRGVTFHFMLHDLFALHHPEWFTKKGVKTFQRWIKSMLKLADNLFCFSRYVAEDFTKTAKVRYGINDLPTHIVPIGLDFSTVMHGTGLPSNFDFALSQIKQHQTLLMVGTIEPRKGYDQVLEAFEYLWLAGETCNLVIVGRPGWKTKKLQKKLRNHPEQGNRLFWFEDASDEALLKLYAVCNGVIVASLAEGFGLPLNEALLHGKPVLARDLPVFRERDQPGIEYFSANDGKELSAQLMKWLGKIENGISIPQPANSSSWKDAVFAMSENFKIVTVI